MESEKNESVKVCKKCGRELPLSCFKKSRWGGHVDVCTGCATISRRENKQKREQNREEERKRMENERRQLRLQDFQPRELIKRLADLGYTGTLQYTKTIDIDITRV